MSAISVYKSKITTITANLGIDVTGDTITSEIREQQSPDSDLIGTWDVTVVTPSTGELSLVFDDSAGTITHTEGWMDLKRVSGGDPIPVLDGPVRVKFVPAVTA